MAHTQLTFAAFALIALMVGAWALAAGSKSKGWATTVTILGALGLTSSGLYARGKASATSMLAEIRAAVERARAGRAATIVPALAKRTDWQGGAALRNATPRRGNGA